MGGRGLGLDLGLGLGLGLSLSLSFSLTARVQRESNPHNFTCAATEPLVYLGRRLGRSPFPTTGAVAYAWTPMASTPMPGCNDKQQGVVASCHHGLRRLGCTSRNCLQMGSCNHHRVGSCHHCHRAGCLCQAGRAHDPGHSRSDAAGLCTSTNFAMAETIRGYFFLEMAAASASSKTSARIFNHGFDLSPRFSKKAA